MKGSRILTLIALCLPCICGAQALQTINIPADARTAGMAGAGAALTADAFVTSRNISAAALADQTAAFGVGYNSWAPSSSSTDIAGIGGFFRFNKFALALEGRYFNEKPYEIISSVSKVLDTYKPKDILIGAGFAYRVADMLSVGVATRFISSDIAEKAKGTAFCADIDATFSKGRLTAAAGIANLGSKISYGGASYTLPTMAKAGVAYSVAGLTASAEADYLFSGALMAGLGVEYGIADISILRAGYHYGDSSKALASYASLGLGLQFAGVSLDLAFLTASQTLGNSLLVGIGYSF